MIEQLNQQLAAAKAKHLEAGNELKRVADEAEAEMESERRRLEKRIKKLEAENNALSEELENELDVIKRNADLQKTKEIQDLEARLKTEAVKHEDELDYANQERKLTSCSQVKS